MPDWPGNFARNTFKKALSSCQRQIGLWSGLCSPIVAEIIAGAGFDWIVIDGEHAPNDISSLLAQLQAMRGGTAEPVFRVPWNDPVIIKRALDVGARSLLVPFVQNAEEARKAVAAARYPPLGIRGIAVATRASDYGRLQGYHANAHLDTCVLVQLESKAALEEIEAIAAVEGVDGLFIGPSDLAGDLGHLGNPSHPEVQAAIQDAAPTHSRSRKIGRHIVPQRRRRRSPHLVRIQLHRCRQRCWSSGSHRGKCRRAVSHQLRTARGSQGFHNPAAPPPLKPENDSSGWLRRVSPAVSVQAPDTKIGVFVQVSPVLGT